MKRIQFLALIVACFTVFALLPINQTHSTVTNPGTFISEVDTFSPTSLDPATNYETTGGALIHSMYEQLFAYTNNSLTETIPSLALNYTISPDGLQYTFNLRSGVRFALQSGESIGQPFNAYVMQYSIDRAIIMNDHAGPAWMIQDWIKGASTIEQTNDINVTQAQTFLSLKSVWATSPNQLTINLTAPFSGFLATLQFPVASAISPKAIIDNEPISYTTIQSDNTYGMISLSDMFPGVSNSTILSNLGLPSNYNVANSGIVPQSGAGTTAGYTWLINHSAGTGPFILQSLSSGSGATLVKNVNWWNSINFAPNGISTIEIVVVTSITTRIDDLKTGTDDESSLAYTYLSNFTNVSGVKSYIYNTLSNEFIGINENPTLPVGQIIENSTSSNYSYGTQNYTRLLKYTWNNTSGNVQYSSPSNPFTSMLFREAFAYAFPTDTYIQQALDGYGIRMQGVIPQGLLGYDNNLIANGNIPTYNTTKAKQLFNKVGFRGTITLTYNSGSNSRSIEASLLKNSIENLGVGINITIAALSWNAYLSSTSTDALFEMGWSPDFADPYDYVVPFYRTGGTFSGAIGYSNPEVQNLISTASSTLNQTARAGIYNQMEINATGDFPYIYVAQSQTLMLVRSWITGVNTPETDSMNPMLESLNYQYLSKVASSSASTSTSTSKSSSSSSTLTPTSSSSSSTSVSTSSSNNTFTSKTLTTTPGFEAGSLIAMFILLTVPLTRRFKKTKK